MRAVSLFSGAGGFELGLERAGIRTVLQAECDPWALAVLRRHWPDVEKVTDVRDVRADRRRLVDGAGAESPRTTGRHSERTDLVYGGFPCQDVSVAGKRAGLGGERSGLWSEFRRVLSELRPRWALVENVPGLLSANDGRDFGQILCDLDDLGLHVAWAVLDAQFFGVPQRRRRVFLVCGPTRRAAEAVLAVCESCGGHPAPRGEAREDIAGAPTVGSAGPGGDGQGQESFLIAEPARCVTARGNRFDGDTDTLLVANSIQASAGHHGHSSPRGDGSDNLVLAVHEDQRTGPVYQNGHTHALSANGGGKPGQGYQAVHYGSNVRRLTPLECERLMGWPDEHTRWTDDGREIPDSHRYRLCGNGVVATVAEWLGHRLVAVDALLKKESAA